METEIISNSNMMESVSSNLITVVVCGLMYLGYKLFSSSKCAYKSAGENAGWNIEFGSECFSE